MTSKADYALIRQSVLGSALNDEQCDTLADLMQVHVLNDGDVLVAEGERNDELHLLVGGQLAVESRWQGAAVVLYKLNVGEFAGTRAFVDHTERRATLRAIGPTTVYGLDPKSFESLLDTEPRIVYEVMRAIFRMTHANLMRMNTESEELKNYFLKRHGRY